MRDYSEDALVEQPAIALFAELGWETANCWSEWIGPSGDAPPERLYLGRETTAEMVLVPKLREALSRLNPKLPSEALDLAIEELAKDRSSMSPAQANREVYGLLKDGVRAAVSSEEAGDEVETVCVIAWNDPEDNDFFLASQFRVSGEMYKRRADLVGFINGLPLVLFELKRPTVRLEHAYRDNVRDYKSGVPRLFDHNAFIVLSNGTESRVGSMTASWEHFAEWKKVGSEEEKGVVSLETMIRGACRKERLLDIVENFTLFSETGGSGGLVKLVAKNHQYLGVNNAVDALENLGENRGRLGVFWHTQGSGKSYSMVFFSQKVLRKLEGDYTFLIVTDRQELDDQIYKTFASVGAVTEGQVQAESGEHLKRLLRENHRNVFTLIQKFHTGRDDPAGRLRYPKLSDRSDVIVMTDEAHRSQYDTFAMNMRHALPNAAFIGFTGTPLMAEEEKTREVFGDYVSVYDFRQSVEDGATVPLYYENRIPELQLTNAAFNEELEGLIEAAELDEAQEKRLEREFGREYHLITRDDRLERVAEDIVSHFTGRGQPGKAMVVSIDKATAVRMHDKVRKYWEREIEHLEKESAAVETLHATSPPATSLREDATHLREKIAFMRETDMAVVVSPGQNEVEDMAKKGLDIASHRRRMLREDMDRKFKDPGDPFRIVFVCAMWMTGFDAPSVGAIYLDKPMRNHTLMQTIARANRVFEGKLNGLIVDYIGVFRNLQKALAIYGSGTDGDMPVKDKEQLVEALRAAVEEAEGFCKEHGMDIRKILAADGFERLALLDDAVEAILTGGDESKKRFLLLAGIVEKLYRAILPDPVAGEFGELWKLFSMLAEKVRSLAPPADISGVMGGVDELLDRSVAAEGYVIRETSDGDDERLVNLGEINFEALRARFERGRRRTVAETLRGRVNAKLGRMARLNKSRTDYQERLRQLISAYNSGSMNVEAYFEALLKFAGELDEEEQRGVSEGLSEEELAVFDLLMKPEVSMTEKERARVKEVARELLDTLKKEKLTLDWRKRQRSRAEVRVAIEESLDELPENFTPNLYRAKCEAVYQHVYDSYYGSGESIYAKAS
ncbi:MAG: type I restriction endonuclease subunit R [Rubrobacteraceae bacterium]